VDFYVSADCAERGCCVQNADLSSCRGRSSTPRGNSGTNPGFPAEPGREGGRSGSISFSIVRGAHQFKSGVDVIGRVGRFVTLFTLPCTYTFADRALNSPFKNVERPCYLPDIQYTQRFVISLLNFMTR